MKAWETTLTQRGKDKVRTVLADAAKVISMFQLPVETRVEGTLTGQLPLRWSDT